MYSRFLVRDQEVEGSNPFAPTISFQYLHPAFDFFYDFAHDCWKMQRHVYVATSRPAMAGDASDLA
jgi:hypothetical protein